MAQTNNMATANLKPILKQSSTDNFYQSTFLPIFQDAETRIKLMILAAFLAMTPKTKLILGIMAIIQSVDHKIPKDLRDRQAYMDGLKKRSNYYIARYYSVPKVEFARVKNKLLKIKPGVQVPNPRELLKMSKSKPMWAEAKAEPYIKDYAKEVYKKMDELAATPLTTAEEGKKPITLWQKAELDVRYNKQLENLDKLKKDGVQYAYISSHPDCSKRCACWQGALVSLTEHAPNPQKEVDKGFHYKKMSFFVKKLDGKNVYSLPDITDVMGPYGYKNNVYIGFNCRHRLIPYDPQKSAPTQFSEQDIKKQREIEEKIRKMERDIRLQKTRILFYEQLDEKKIAKDIENKCKIMVERYKAYCERNGYAWNEYRIRIREGSNKYL